MKNSDKLWVGKSENGSPIGFSLVFIGETTEASYLPKVEHYNC
jgi:hypothetical protein